MSRALTTEQKNRYRPDPCPACGTPDPRVEWINATLNAASPEMWLPGMRTCRKLGCVHSESPAGIGGDSFPDCPECGSGVTNVSFVHDESESRYTLGPCDHVIPGDQYQVGERA